MGDSLSEVVAVWAGEVRRALTSGRLAVLTVLFVLVTAVTLAGVGGAVSLVTREADKAVADAVANGVDPSDAKKQLLDKKRDFLSNFINDTDYVAAVVELPVVLLAAFKLLTWFVPFFVVLMGFDQLSGEVGPKSIRYLVVRVRRRSILLGKLLAQVSTLALMLLVGTALMLGVTRYFNPDFGFGAMASWGARLFLALAALGVTWACLTALFSAFFKTPGVSLVMNLIAVLSLAFLSSVGGWFRFPSEAAQGMFDQFARDESLAAYLRYGSVWHFSQNLIHPSALALSAAFLMHLGWALAFVGFASVTLDAKDV